MYIPLVLPVLEPIKPISTNDETEKVQKLNEQRENHAEKEGKVTNKKNATELLYNVIYEYLSLDKKYFILELKKLEEIPKELALEAYNILINRCNNYDRKIKFVKVKLKLEQNDNKKSDD